MKNNKAFTLIEMLVVIAMIGLLSAVLLVALGPSRNKAKNARIISDVKQMVAIGQTFYDPITATFDINSFKNSEEVKKLEADIKNQGVNFDINSNVSSTGTYFKICAPLLGEGNFCSDSDGLTSAY